MSHVSTRQKVGLAIAGLLSALNITSAFQPTPDGDTGPPFGILLIGSVLGVVGLIAVVLAWRGSRAALRVAAGCLIISTITALPAFFVDVSMGLKMLVGGIVLLTVAALVLMLSPERAPAAVPVPDGGGVR